MDILTHTLSGIAIGSVIGIRSKSVKPFVIGGIGSALPDIDAISLWSKFDGTIGSWCDLNHSGHDIYFGKFWYSHHAFMHSLAAACFFGFLLYSISRFIYKSKNAKAYGFALACGFTMHLLGDMPTPGSTWDGIALWWPSTHYAGGSGDVWWWNNYDVFLITLCITVANTFIFLIDKYLLSKSAYKLGLLLFVVAFCLAFYQIKTRNYDFDYTGFSTDFGAKEAKSLEIQKKILGDKWFGYMQYLDSHVKIYF
jgi:inner membrane protein